MELVTQRQFYPAAEVGVTKYSLPVQRLLRSFQVTGTRVMGGGGGGLSANNWELQESARFISVLRINCIAC
jgi:hypothetical protein